MSSEKTTTDKTMQDQASVIYVAPDCTDSAVQKRVQGLLSEGLGLISFSFRRSRYNVDFVPDWPNVELGVTTEQRLATRLLLFFRALKLIYGRRRVWREASVLYARNLDLALLALIAKSITRCRAPFVYEILDVHPAMTKRGLRSAALRWLDRWVLARCQLLVVSSPAFLEHYFQPMQGYRGKAFLLENKWSSEQMSDLPRKLSFELNEAAPRWTIGWFGNIRCPKSLEILTELADALPDRVRIYIRGCASLLGEQKLIDAAGQRENIVFEGEYCAPSELPAVYSNVHFNWCIDLCGGDNSRWLLPNRIYEGGYFGIPALAVASHETGRTVSKRELGISLKTPLVEHLCDILTSMSCDQYLLLRRRIESLPEGCFVDKGDLEKLIQCVSPQGLGRRKSKTAGDVQHAPTGRAV